MNLFTYISAFTKIFKAIRAQKKYNKSFLLPYLTELEIKCNGQFGDEQKKKITDYYGLYISAFLCGSYKKLYGKALDEEERKRATLFGILTPVGDDLFDKDKLNADDIKQITFHPEQFIATTFSSQVAKEIQTFLLQNVPDKEAYTEASKNVLEIQLETHKQTLPDISHEELKRITYTKGAASVIIYHQVLNETATDEMLNVLFHIGSLFQLGNDIFDLYKDVRDNIYTLVNTCDSYAELRKEFLNRVREQNVKIMSLPYPQKNKSIFCITMNVINARSMVALDKLNKHQKKAGGKINWWQKQRKEMIVDMEKPKNIFKWLYYTYKLAQFK